MSSDRGALAWYLDRDGRLCYHDLVGTVATNSHRATEIFPTEKIDERVPALVRNSDFLWREYKRLTDVLIDGDYIGPLKGETNVALNVAHYLACFEMAAKESLPAAAFQRLRERAHELRKQRYPGALRW